MVTAEWIINQFEEWSPEYYAEEWDNVGLLIGDDGAEVNKILVALDATEDVVNEAISGKFDFLICHHPIVYNPIKRVTTADSIGRKMIALIKNGIGCFCAHTNLDKAIGGVNDCLAEKLKLENIVPLIPEENHLVGIGRVGFLPDVMTLSEFGEYVKKALSLPSVRYAGASDKIVQKIGLCGGNGSGSVYTEAAIAQNCDVYITGDLTYHRVQEALECGIAFLDITHYDSEVLITEAIVSRLKNAAKNQVEIFASSINGQVFYGM